MRNALLFILLISFWNCSGGYRTQKDQLRPAENSQKEDTAYVLDIYKENSERISMPPRFYSAEMLRDTLHALETLFNKKKKTLPQSLRMSRFEIYEPKNTIMVLLEDSTADAVSTFKKYVMDSPMIQFAQQPIIYLH